MSCSIRDPYPMIKYENDETFADSKPSQKTQYSKPSHLAQQEDPWNRLNSQNTLSSTRHQVFYRDGQAPDDELDFVIKAKYNQHRDLFKTKSQSLVQPETMLGEKYGRILKNRIVVEKKETLALNHPLRIAAAERREHIDSINQAIESVHTQETIRGFSRKADGGFYTS